MNDPSLGVYDESPSIIYRCLMPRCHKPVAHIFSIYLAFEFCPLDLLDRTDFATEIASDKNQDYTKDRDI